MDDQSPSIKKECGISPIELPEEIIRSEILVRLRTKTLIRLKCVCKRWKAIISSPQFANSHLRFLRSSSNPQQCLLINEGSGSSSPTFFTFDFSLYDTGEIVPISESNSDSELHEKNPNSKEGFSERSLGNDLQDQIGDWNDWEIDSREQIGLSSDREIEVVGSCDGLVCIHLQLDVIDYVCIWNPITQESRKVPILGSFLKGEAIWGFGYASSVDDHKIVTISHKMDDPIKKAHSLGLKDGNWRDRDVIDGFYMNTSSHHGVVADEKVFWILPNEYESCIVGFDLVSENSQEVHMPEWMREFKCFALYTIGKCLGISYTNDDGILEVAMLKHYGDGNSWTKLFRFESDFFPDSKLLGFTLAGKCLFEDETDEGEESQLLLVDVKQNPPSYVEILRLGLELSDAMPFFETLISPYG